MATGRAAAGPWSSTTVIAWGVWNAGAAAYHAVILTFVFSVYLTSAVGRDLPGPISADAWLGYAMSVAGLVVAVLAPVTGQRADVAGRRKRATLVWTALTVASMAALCTIRQDWHWLALGLVLLGLGSVFAELASVSYNAMLCQIATPATMGRVSGFGWSMGFVGGIVLLPVVYVGLIAGDGGLVGAPTADGFNIRLVALVAAVWFAVLAVPLFVTVPEMPPAADAGDRPGVSTSYRQLGRDLRELYSVNRPALWFLGASALYRDGLAAIATFTAVLAVKVYGVDAAHVLLYGVAANVVAAAGALAGGVLEDRVGSKTVIVGSLLGLLLSGVVLLFVSGPAMFWILGLMAAVFLGPTHSSSRTFLARLAPAGRIGQLFGLYATTGRAATFLGPLLFGLFIALSGEQRAGIVGILLLLLAGLLALLPVPASPPGGSRQPVARSHP
ncbi:MFS transporter [Pseudonocardia charpentierae]|uniref:MFS transporter n=1 Tax=Pseudonocardia charpentierae TaxID=3075545 RepID=A0ABU2NFV7_9PSEU|nr:MFS transporter [Pseudonocardia sp. DSM 45834]MDT0352841.1 MFS transporter [Pseudonocardia sp. DSM 45834]